MNQAAPGQTPSPPLAFPDGTLWNLVERRAVSTPDATFAVDEHGRAMTFSQLRDRALDFAKALHESGIGVGDAVSWQLPTRFESIVVTLALARLGAVQNPILPIYRERELSYVVAQTKARLLIVPREWRGTDYASLAQRCTDPAVTDVLVLDDGTMPPGRSAELPPPPPVPVDGDHPVRWIYYTSGTTASPKGARHTDHTLVASSLTVAERLRVGPDDRIGLVFPYAHIGGANFLIASLWSGCSLICVEAFDPQTSIRMLDSEGATLAGAGTVFHLAYLEARRADPTGRVLSSVRAFPGGAAPKPGTLHAEMKAAFGGTGVVSGYGLTEAPVLTMGSIDDPDDRLARSEGRPSDGVELRALDPLGGMCPTDIEGEIWVKGPMLCKGYVDPDLTAAAFTDEGFFATGDLGSVDAQGYVTITGRMKDVIIRKGENISAKEVEDLIFAVADVDDVAVIGLPDEARGERCCAVVVVTPGAHLDLASLVARLRDRGLMAHKLPEQLEVVSALPRNPAGKVLKRELQQRFA